MTFKEFLESWMYPVLCLIFLVGFFWIAIKTGWVETPKKTKERKINEDDEVIRKKEEYESLSPEGKLLHKLTEKQAQTELYTRAIYGAIMGGAIGYLIFYFWPF